MENGYSIDVVDMIINMNAQIQKCGGRTLSIYDMNQIKIIDFIEIYASNGIRFIYDEKFNANLEKHENN